MPRMSIVGCEASGKTVFMAALADYYSPASTSHSPLCLVPENQAANRFAAFQRRQMRSLRQWPPATNPTRTVALGWTLRSGGETLAEMSMLEFGGETFRAAFRDEEGASPRKAAVKELMDHLSSSDFVVVLVSLKELLRDPGDITMEEFERDTESLWVTRGLLDFVRDRLPGAGVVIGLTQADRYHAELDAAGGAAALFSSRWPTIRAVAPDVPVVEIASVSATDAEGRPAEGYTTEGILPAMREMARTFYGGTSSLLAELSSAKSELESFDAKASPSGYSSRTRKFAAKLATLHTCAALEGADCAGEAAELSAALESFRAIERESRPQRKKQAGRRRKKRPVGRRVTRRTVALFVVFAALAAAYPWAAKFDAARFMSVVPESVPGAAAATPPRQRDEASEPATADQEDAALIQMLTTFSNRLERAESGDAKCKRWVAGQYYAGGGAVERDLVQARRLYREAAELGDAESQACLAVMCENGEGGETNAVEALGWYFKAAEGGAADAMYRMGVECWNSRTNDAAQVGKANEWFRRAKSAGLSDPSLDDWIKATSR